MKTIITINMDNVSFGDDPRNEVARILRELADNIFEVALLPDTGKRIRDKNGNVVGEMITE